MIELQTFSVQAGASVSQLLYSSKFLVIILICTFFCLILRISSFVPCFSSLKSRPFPCYLFFLYPAHAAEFIAKNTYTHIYIHLLFFSFVMLHIYLFFIYWIVSLNTTGNYSPICSNVSRGAIASTWSSCIKIWMPHSESSSRNSSWSNLGQGTFPLGKILHRSLR